VEPLIFGQRPLPVIHLLLLPAAGAVTNEANSTTKLRTTMPRKAQHRARAVAGARRSGVHDVRVRQAPAIRCSVAVTRTRTPSADTFVLQFQIIRRT